jgi:glycine/D-amino acid oxidase-like deaminating enzyme
MREIDRRFLHEELYRDLSPVRDKRVVICGCGALGGWAAVHLAKMGMRSLVLIDDDEVREHNLGTQPFRLQDIGGRKAMILANDLYRLTGTCKAEPIARRLTAENAERFLKGAAVVLETFDNSGSRRAVHEACVKLKIPCLHAGMSGEGTGDLHWESGYTVPPDVELADPCAYPLGLVLVNLASALAAELIVRFLLTGEKKNYLVLRDRLSIVEK